MGINIYLQKGFYWVEINVDLAAVTHLLLDLKNTKLKYHDALITCKEKNLPLAV